MTKERQLKKQEEIKNKILQVAEQIIKEEGVEGLSIRKITKAMDYSPGIIYHYFKDKNEIIDTLMGKGYQKILQAVMKVERNDEHPELEIKQAFIYYLEAVLENPEEYKSVMLNSDPTVLNRTAILKEGISSRSETMFYLTEVLEKAMSSGYFRAMDVELTAQILWTSIYGLVMRLITEKISVVQQKRLINHHFQLIFQGLLKN